MRSLGCCARAASGHAAAPPTSSDHPDVALSLNNLALLYQNEGRYADAEPLFKRLLAIRENALGRDHPDVAVSMNNLASLYQNEDRYADALPLVQGVIANGRASPVVALVVRAFVTARSLAAGSLPKGGKCREQCAPMSTVSSSRSETRLSSRSNRDHR
jgi:tetratricopeptide (TPR) repeat protein